jgi:asparagine synthase (glutamine-hydrolysing)
VGIIFSGGIDSVLIAYLVHKMGVPFTCYTAGGKGARDLEWAESVARRFNFPLKAKTLMMEEIQTLIPQVIKDIEDHSSNQVEVSIPIYAAVRMAQEEGERVILTGQGADELFGGYPWYSKIVEQEGYKSFEKHSWEDTFLLYKECLEREDKISMAHSLELRVPFLDVEVIQAAFQISPELKIRPSGDRLGKRIHREYGASIGIPEGVAFREKEAAQHGANIHDAIELLAGKTGITETNLKDAGYDPNQSVTEKLGSSSRYGFRYGDHHLWKPQAQVQYYLDCQAADLNVLPQDSRTHWLETTRRLEIDVARGSS